MKIMEDHDAVLVMPDEATPDDVTFGRVKPLAVFQTWRDAEAWVKQQEILREAWLDHGHLHL